MYTYTWYQWLLFFYLYCFMGWCIESTYVSIKSKKPVNRGFLKAPLLPIYGSGAIIMLFVSIPVEDHVFLVFLFGMIAATALEYVTGACMERLFKIKYWDYSNNRFQLHGYISLGSSIAWGFLSVFLINIVHKPIEALILNRSVTSSHIAVIVISALFVIDGVSSTRAALDLAKILESLTRIKEEWEEIQTQLDDLKLTMKKQVDGFYESTEQRLEEIKENAVDQVVSVKEYYEKQRIALSEKLKALGEERENTSNKLNFSKINLLKRNPGATSRFSGALKEIKEWTEKLYKDKE